MSDMKMVRLLALRVAERGGRVYYVGGLVRDRLLGRENLDIDVEVHGLAPAELEEILDGLGGRLQMGASFGVYGLRGYDLDIAMPRKERATGRGHRDFQVDVDPFIGTEKAARRRDFTINAMMEDVLTGQIIDHFGGQEDLNAGVLRHVCTESFGEDALRVLRGAQFAARFGLAVAPETVALCKTLDLSVLPGERVLEELRKALLKAKRPSAFFELLRQMGQLSVWFPEVEALIGVPQPPRYHREGDVWTHTMMVLDQAALRRAQTKQRFWFMLAALTHDFGKPVCTEQIDGNCHAYGHEEKGLPLVRAFLTRLTRETALMDYVTNLVELHMKPNKLQDEASIKSSNKLFDEAVEPEDLIQLAVCDDLGRIRDSDSPSRETFLRQRLSIYREYMSRPYVMGRDLVEHGLQPGAEFRSLLELAHKLRLAGVDRETVLRQVLGESRKRKA